MGCNANAVYDLACKVQQGSRGHGYCLFVLQEFLKLVPWANRSNIPVKALATKDLQSSVDYLTQFYLANKAVYHHRVKVAKQRFKGEHDCWLQSARKKCSCVRRMDEQIFDFFEKNVLPTLIKPVVVPEPEVEVEVEESKVVEPVVEPTCLQLAEKMDIQELDSVIEKLQELKIKKQEQMDKDRLIEIKNELRLERELEEKAFNRFYDDYEEETMKSISEKHPLMTPRRLLIKTRSQLRKEWEDLKADDPDEYEAYLVNAKN